MKNIRTVGQYCLGHWGRIIVGITRKGTRDPCIQSHRGGDWRKAQGYLGAFNYARGRILRIIHNYFRAILVSQRSAKLLYNTEITVIITHRMS